MRTLQAPVDNQSFNMKCITMGCGLRFVTFGQSNQPGKIIAKIYKQWSLLDRKFCEERRLHKTAKVHRIYIANNVYVCVWRSVKFKSQFLNQSMELILTMDEGKPNK